MKRCLAMVTALLLLLTGCRGLYPSDYISVESNQAPYAYRETTAPAVTDPTEFEPELLPVSTLGEIRKGIQALVSEGEPLGRFLLHDYLGDTTNLAERVRNHMLSYAPKYLYAMDQLELQEEASGEDIILTVSYVPTMSPEEFSAIGTSRYADAIPQIYEALRERKSSYTVEIISYQETDFNRLLDEYAIAHPDEIIEVPEIRTEVFPKQEGFVRVVKLDFSYKTELSTLQWQQKTVVSLLEGFQTNFRPYDSPQQLLDAMYLLLVPAGGSTNDDDATVFSLFLSKIGSSRMMASVAAWFRQHAEQESGVVVGERRSVQKTEETEKEIWEPWYWNWIRDGEEYRFFDLHAAALDGVEPALLSYEEMMQDYRWDPERYPAFVPSEEEPAPEETQPTESQPPETQPPEPPEETQPTETQPEEPPEEPPEETQTAETQPEEPPETETEAP